MTAMGSPVYDDRIFLLGKSGELTIRVYNLQRQCQTFKFCLSLYLLRFFFYYGSLTFSNVYLHLMRERLSDTA